MAAAGGDEETKSGLTGDTMMTGAGGGGPDGPRAFGDSAIDAPSRELARITRRYTGHGLVQRLRFAARAVPATAKRQAYEQLLQEVYTEFSEACGGVIPPFSDVWARDAQARASKTLGMLERQLSNAHGMPKENTRRALMELGEYHVRVGNTNAAMNHYHKTQHLSTNLPQLVESCITILCLALLCKMHRTIPSVLAKAEKNVAQLLPQNREGSASTAVASKELQTMASRVAALAGLHALQSQHFRGAVASFLKVDPARLGLSQIVCGEDIALYAGCCALATSSRDELAQLLDTNLFAADTCQLPAMRTAVEAFLNSRFAECLSALESVTPRLRYDFFASEVANTLVGKIRAAAVRLYCQPYSSVCLERMATAFHTSVPALESELAVLIAANKLQACIDSHHKVLRARESDARAVTYERALDMGSQYIRDTQAMLLHMSLEQKRVVVQGPPTRRTTKSEYQSAAAAAGPGMDLGPSMAMDVGMGMPGEMMMGGLGGVL